MGIRENFTQAVKELAGSGKEQIEKTDKGERKLSQVDDLRRAIESDTADRIAPVYGRTEELPSIQEQSPSFPTGGQYPFPQKNAPMSEMNLNFSKPEQGIQTYPTLEPAQAAPSQSAAPPIPTPHAQHTQNPQSPPGEYPNAASGINGFSNNYNSYSTPPSNGGYGINGFSGNSASAQSTPAPSQNFSTVSTMTEPADLMNGEELTVISKNTVIEGNIRSFANMNIEGNIRGDVETTKNIDLNGKVIGNLTCNNAQMLTSQIQGNIRMKGNIIMGRDTLLIGDLVSTYAKVNGKVKGNLEVGGKAELKGDAVIFGDISASTITVDDGAIIQGYVSTTFLNKEESRNIFPESISIAE